MARVPIRFNWTKREDYIASAMCFIVAMLIYLDLVFDVIPFF